MSQREDIFNSTSAEVSSNSGMLDASSSSGGKMDDDSDYVPESGEKCDFIYRCKIDVPKSLDKLDFDNIIQIVDRFGISNPATAHLLNAAFEMVKLITIQSTQLVITECFIDRKRRDCRARTWEISQKYLESIAETIQCLSFDGKKKAVPTITKNTEDGIALTKKMIRMENVVILRHPETEALGFISCLKGTASDIFTAIWKHINPTGRQFRKLVASMCDGASVNTGNLGGIIVLIEGCEHVRRNIHRLVCLLHTNEIGLKELIVEIDGKLNSAHKLSGPVGMEMHSDSLAERDVVNFNAISSRNLPSEIDQSGFRGDQKHMLELSKAVDTGICTIKIARKHLALFNACRWTSACIRILRVYISTKDPSTVLITLVTYVQQVYIPTWFSIRIKPQWENGPRHLFNLVDWTRKAQNNLLMLPVIHKIVKNNSTFAHCENILIGMITDECEKVRREGYRRILKIRQDKSREERINDIRPFTKPGNEELNFGAQTYHDFLRPKYFTYEPPYTILTFSDAEMNNLARRNVRLLVPRFLCHTQETERHVALMSKSINRVAHIENQNAIFQHKIASAQRSSYQIKKRKYNVYNSKNDSLRGVFARKICKTKINKKK